MNLVANAHPSSANCALTEGDACVPVIANGLIEQCFFCGIKLIQVMADTGMDDERDSAALRGGLAQCRYPPNDSQVKYRAIE